MTNDNELRTSLQSKPVSELLDQAEILIVKSVSGTAFDLLPLLVEMDEIQSRLKNNVNDRLKADRAHFDFIQSEFRKNAAGIIKNYGGAGRFVELRNQNQAGSENWWWYLDRIVREQQQKSVKRLGLIVGAAVLAISILAVVYRLFLAPDPAIIQRIEHQRAAETALMEGNYSTALEEVELAAEADPTNLEVQLLKGAVLQQLGRTDEAQAVFENAEKQAGGRMQFLLARTLAYMQSGNLDAAEENANEVILLEPESPEGHYYLALIYQSTGRLEPALLEYQSAYDLADSQEKSQLAATIRVNMGMLLQSMQTRIESPTVSPGE